MLEGTNIPDQLTYHEVEAHAARPEVAKDRLYLPATAISALFTPFMLPFVAFLMLFFFTFLRVTPWQYKVMVLSVVYCFTILMPMLGIYLFQKLNGWGIHELGEREKRFVPYILTILSYIACYITMLRIHTPGYMSGIILATLICMTLCALVNVRLKVSTHMASCGVMVGGLVSFSMLFQFNPVVWLCLFILLAGMLGSARMILRQHTLAEVGGGFFIGLLCGITGILFI